MVGRGVISAVVGCLEHAAVVNEDYAAGVRQIVFDHPQRQYALLRQRQEGSRLSHFAPLTPASDHSAEQPNSKRYHR